MVRNDIKNSSLLKTKFLIYAFNGRTFLNGAWDTEICFVGCLIALYLPFSMANSLTNRRERIKRCLAK